MKKTSGFGLDEIEDYNIGEADYLLRETIHAIKGSIDQIYFGLFDFLDEDEKAKFLEKLKEQSDALPNVLFKSIIEKAGEISELNSKLVKYNNELVLLKENLEHKVIERTQEIQQVQHVTIFALARLAESRDNETGNHLKRMRTYSYMLAKRLMERGKYQDYIDQNYIENIYESSPLHDIGKVGIPDKILLKPGRLTEDEFEMMKTHTIIGGDTLDDAERQLEHKTKSFLSMGKKIAYCHHEQWDGSGYPFGLKRSAIPLSARITALADVYDALTSNRIYKKALSHEVAKEIIKEENEKHFDPYVVEAFFELEVDFKNILEEHKD